MKFTEKMAEIIDDNFTEKRKAKPIRGCVIGLGIKMVNGINGASVARDDVVIGTVEELGRMIEEMQMLKAAIEEETGLVL